MSEKEIINKVAQSQLITFNLEDYLPPRMAELDLCTLVEDGMLREEAFRNTLKAKDFSAYENAVVRLYLSEDLILPAWAPILLSSRLADLGIASIWAPNSETFWSQYFREVLGKLDYSTFEGKPVILKGCGDKRIPRDAYVQAIQHLKSVAKKISYGEACSAVPLK